MNKLIASMMILVAGISCLTYAQADVLIVRGKVVESLVADGNRWGACAVKLDKEIGGLCNGNWVSFSCSGDYTTKDVAYRMFDTALMAYALDREVKVWAQDTKLHNGFCYSARIDVMPAEPAP